MTGDPRSPLSRTMRYRLDALTISTFLATAFDAWTTYYFISRDIGYEQNIILGPLAAHSLAWIPIYLFTPVLLFPLMPDGCRQTFAVPYLAAGLLLGFNNLQGILTGQFRIVDALGFGGAVGICIGLGVATFVYQLAIRFTDWRSAARAIVIVLAWLAALVAIEFLYYLLGRFLHA